MIRRQSGQSVIEYALLFAFIALVVIAALILLGGGIGNVFQRTSDALGDGEESTPTPGPTATPDAYTFSCSADLALSKESGMKFVCNMDPGISQLEEVETVSLSIEPMLPDFHIVMLQLPSLRETRFFCGPGGCRGFSGSKSYLYPFSDTSDTLPDEWTSTSSLSRWITKMISGRARYYRLNGDGTIPGSWVLQKPAEPWAGTLHVTVVGKPASQ